MNLPLELTNNLIVNNQAAFVDVGVPLRLGRLLTYQIPPYYQSHIQRGMRLFVPFKNKIIGAVAWNVHHQKVPYVVKPVLAVPDQVPLLSTELIKLIAWMKNYYMSHLGEVMYHALDGAKPWLTPNIPPDWQATIAEKGLESQLPRLREAIKKGMLTIANPLPKGFSYSKDMANVGELTHNLDLDDQKLTIEKLIKQVNKGGITFLQGGNRAMRHRCYQHLIAKVIAQQKQFLYCVDTPFGLQRAWEELNPLFKEGHIGRYHGSLKREEKTKVWEAVATGKCCGVITRLGGLFLPFAKLGLIIVDQAESQGYRQVGSRFSYQGKDALIMRSHYAKVPIVLGDILPSVESYYNAKVKKYFPLNLAVPKPLPIDFLHVDKRKGKEAGPQLLIAPKMMDKIRAALTEKKTVIILQDRRGYAQYHICVSCETIVRCEKCQISLTYHQEVDQLQCHRCKISQSPNAVCAVCMSSHIRQEGVGIQQTEEFLHYHFADYTIVRVDADVSSQAYREGVTSFSKGHVDILLGTRQLIKLLPSSSESLVIVLDHGDWMGKYNFREPDRFLRDLAQLSVEQGSCWVQTGLSQTRHIVGHLKQGPLVDFYEKVLGERKQYNYPPFARFVQIGLYHGDEKYGWDRANHLVDYLGTKFKVLGPFAKLPNEKEKKGGVALWVHLPEKYLDKAKKQLRQQLAQWYKHSKQGLQITCSVDPT